MRVTLIAICEKLPAWVVAGVEDYARRLRPPFGLTLVDLPLAPRPKLGVADCLKHEAERLRKAIPKGARMVALHEGGRTLGSEALAGTLTRWQHETRELALLIGGPDGLDRSLLAEAHQCWSLSALTLPHALVKVLVAEQLYRVQALAHGHPYHRGVPEGR
ncbi:MAG: 23S rRNA (pseudouridine(1915)-N(3))-methyltransferase RlmH [Xanthomonadales bacterium]|nr:23S rRNA (pseudouridine(1915)-N(3))-methyltransferase RlmH [Xanthomonadales bacterium]